MKFGEATEAIRVGKRVTREGWNGKGMWLALQRPDVGSEMTEQFIFMVTVEGKRVPWVASQTDILAEDWKLVPEPQMVYRDDRFIIEEGDDS